VAGDLERVRTLRRRDVLRGIVGVGAAAALGASYISAKGEASAKSRKYRVGYLMPRSGECELPGEWEVVHGAAVKLGQPRPRTGCPDFALYQALEERGYRQGKNVEWLSAGPLKLVELGAGGGEGDFAQPAAYLAALQVDVIVARGENAAIAAKRATTTIPIVLDNVDDVVETGLVPSLARPGGNITGVSVRTVDIAIKRIEMLRRAFPSVKRPMLIYGTSPSHVAAIGPAVGAARQLGLSPVAIQFAPSSCRPSVPADLMQDVHMQFVPFQQRAAALSGALSREESAWVLFCSDNEWSDFYARTRQALSDGADSVVVIAEIAAPWALADSLRWSRLPGVFPTTDYLDDGVGSIAPSRTRRGPAFAGFGAICLRESTDLSIVLAAYVERILKGADPSELSIVSPTEFELVVNLRIAQTLGLKVASAVLANATTVIR
jgi:putative ABC transport system substrate-binding protein